VPGGPRAGAESDGEGERRVLERPVVTGAGAPTVADVPDWRAQETVVDGRSPVSTWFPESPGDDGSPGSADRTTRSRSGDQYADDYREERYPLAPGDSFELPTRRPQTSAPGAMFEPALPGSMFEPAAPGSMFEPAPARETSPRQGPPAPALQNQETQFLPSAGTSEADSDRYGDRDPGPPPGDSGYSSRQPAAPSATPSYDAAPVGGRRSGRGNPPPPPPPPTRGRGPGPLIPPSGAPLGDRPAPGYSDQPGPGGPDRQRRAPDYAEPQYGGQQYDSPPYADSEPGGPSSGRRGSQPPGPDPEGPLYAEGGYQDEPYGGRSAPDAAPPRSRGGEAPGQAAGQSLSRLLAAVAWPVMAIGLFVSEGGSSAFNRIPTWSGFALLCLVLVGIGAFGGAQGPGSGRTWTLGVIGACGLVAFWILLVLPAISRNTSFALTLGVALASAAVWLTPGRRRGGM
jgi:hypothetical protein